MQALLHWQGIHGCIPIIQHFGRQLGDRDPGKDEVLYVEGEYLMLVANQFQNYPIARWCDRRVVAVESVSGPAPFASGFMHDEPLKSGKYDLDLHSLFELTNTVLSAHMGLMVVRTVPRVDQIDPAQLVLQAVTKGMGS